MAGSRDGHISQAAVERQGAGLFGVNIEERPIHGLALTAMAGHGIAVIEMAGFGSIKLNPASGVQLDGQVALAIDFRQGAELPVRDVLLPIEGR